jgi:UDP-N-acetylglucosamine 2-epimerase (non-hydrolysing)
MIRKVENMSEKVKLLLIAGARPNFMKIAPLIKSIKAHNRKRAAGAVEIDYRLVHTGQHYDEKMSDVFFTELGIPAPDVNLGVGSGSHAVQTATVMTAFEQVVLEHRPDWVVVVGDVNSTMACALVCSKLGVRVAHVEAGLRSCDRTMPEEINRLVTDAIADLLLTPSEDANENLRKEGVPETRIHLVGNIMIDSLLDNLPQARQSSILRQHGLEHGRYVYVTLHRPSNVDHRDSLAAIMAELHHTGARFPVVFPMHPRTRKMLSKFGIAAGSNGTLRIIEPVGYHDSLCLTENARLVLTDSGGLQEESTYFRTPCLTLRPNTERPVTVSVGSNRLTDVARLPADLETVLGQGSRLGAVPPLWDGHTAERVIHALTSAHRPF